MRKKEKQIKPLTTRQVDRLLSRISFAAAALVLATAAFVTIVLSLLLPSTLYPWNETLLLALLILLPLYIVCRLRLRHYLGKPLLAYPNAVAYFSQTTAASRGIPVIPLLLLGVGILLSIYSAFVPDGSENATLAAVRTSLIIAGAIFTAFRLTKQALLCKLTLSPFRTRKIRMSLIIAVPTDAPYCAG